jgi:hypothetical protein
LVSFGEPAAPDLYYPVIFSDGIQVGLLSPIKIGVFSPNLKYVEDLPNIVDLPSGATLSYSGFDYCGEASWSADSKHILAVCGNSNTSGDIFLFSIEDLSVTQVTECDGKHHLCSDPSWSPDGSWVAYYYSVQASGRHAQNGLHIMNTQCFSTPSSCVNDNDIGLDAGFPYTWSPDGHFLAGRWGTTIRMFEINNGIAALSKSYQLDTSIVKTSWSPSGKWIAVDTEDGVFLVSTETGEKRPLGIKTFYYWISVP